MGKRARTAVARTLGLLVLAAVVVAGTVAFAHRQDIQDHFKARAFEPSDRVVEVLDNLDLTDSGERIFLASEATVDGGQRFNEQCDEVDHSEQGHVLGCFANGRIHLFDVTDERVSGIVEVTAAHELLHAAWSRLGDGERAELIPRLRDAYEEISAGDPDLADRMTVYTHLSDAAFANELHSVLGTEVRELPQWLEQHYARWFEDRGALVDHFDDYHAVFADLQQQSEALQAEMTALRSDVERRNADYDAAVEQFNRDVSQFNARNERYEFAADPGEFTRIRDELQARRAALETTLAGLQADIDRYNEMRDHLQELGQLSTELDQQLDSDLAPVTTRPDA